MNGSLVLTSLLVASFLLVSSIALVPYFSANVVRAQQDEDQAQDQGQDQAQDQKQGQDQAQDQKQGQGQVKHVTLIASEKQVEVAPDNALHPGGITYNAYTFNGTIPAPVISINQGDTLNITLKNEGKTIHSLDFHAGYGPGKALSGSVKPGESKTWSLTGEFPG
ncbi:MAG: multicopper oxidase domain-containing protein, partial [Nitrososphaeraceae archaeon]